MELNSTHLDVLRIVGDLQTADRVPGTRAVGARLREAGEQRGELWLIVPTAPWWGTRPYAQELETLGLLDIDPGIAELRSPEQPIPSAEEYWLELTDAGRDVLANSQPPS